ncbi:TPA_asm: RNA-directed RNA polymerase [ssRNA phage Gephyllon.3_13]|uniref:RNA-directed RNA polymerase n=2 Tax=Leviviricetes TaxID=2842243 RepID=A0A8S5KZ55_9VIRU|nr:RNA-directed RNA polymerase [ssRNA phage Gephyllon.3_13]QDH86992.1 MAG: RNA-dependent RNA polymerase [Leviviridae sp.]DAD50584.1 TPA_asm: RNA-directed RNA polymerase [ssRNA phage Gephyllon.3_13]
MKRLMSLWSRVAEESATLCCTSAHRDINTVAMRIEHEGWSFMTITLPDLGKSFQRWLDQGKVANHSAFTCERGGSFPRFLGGFFSRVFDRSSGLLLDKPCDDSIKAIRQLTLMFGKMELKCSPARESLAVRGYIECEQEVRLFDKELSESDLREFVNMSDMLFRTVFRKVDRDVYLGRYVPRHGPGSTADGLKGNQKFRQETWTERLEYAGLAAGENLLPNWRCYDQLEGVDFLEPGAEVPVKVTLVPKTLKTPRVIAMEPTCMQYMQQAVLQRLLTYLDKDNFLARVIGFDDQTPNQELARRGSIDNRTATLDLSDASDRVSNQLVRGMLRHWPHLSGAVDATRSRRAELPGGGVIRLAKFASMGSALCFPIEAMVFTTLIFVGIQRSLNKQLCRKDLVGFADSVRVFGDDLIVPRDHVPSVVSTLEHFGARVGTDKSFWTGKFRESCGREYFNGTDVSIVRVRQAFPTRRQDASEVISLVSLRNQLYYSGYWQTVKWLDGQIEKVLTHFPTVQPTSSLLGRVSFLSYKAEAQWQPRSHAEAKDLLPKDRRLHPRLHIPLVKGYVVEAKPPRDLLGGTGALLKCLLKLDEGSSLRDSIPCSPDSTSLDGFRSVPRSSYGERSPRVNENHLERSGRPKSSTLKLGWRSPL